jgi:hypothetical protein
MHGSDLVLILGSPAVAERLRARAVPDEWRLGGVADIDLDADKLFTAVFTEIEELLGDLSSSLLDLVGLGPKTEAYNKARTAYKAGYEALWARGIEGLERSQAPIARKAALGLLRLLTTPSAAYASDRLGADWVTWLGDATTFLGEANDMAPAAAAISGPPISAIRAWNETVVAQITASSAASVAFYEGSAGKYAMMVRLYRVFSDLAIDAAEQELLAGRAFTAGAWVRGNRELLEAPTPKYARDRLGADLDDRLARGQAVIDAIAGAGIGVPTDAELRAHIANLALREKLGAAGKGEAESGSGALIAGGLALAGLAALGIAVATRRKRRKG